MAFKRGIIASRVFLPQRGQIQIVEEAACNKDNLARWQEMLPFGVPSCPVTAPVSEQFN
jgi:hypothetical protein